MHNGAYCLKGQYAISCEIPGYDPPFAVVCLLRHAVPHPYCGVRIDPAFCPLWDDKMSIRAFGPSNTNWQIHGRNRIWSDGPRLVKWTGWTPI